MVVTFLTLFFKYSLMYGYLYFCGSSLFLLINYIRKRDANETHILYTKVTYLYPLIGIVFVSNLLFIFNTFFPLDSLFINLLLFLITIPSLFKTFGNLEIQNIQKIKSIFNVFIYTILISGYK